MKDIIDKAEKFRDDSEIVQLYDYEKMRDDRERMAKKIGIEEGIEQGKEQGIEQEKINIVKNMLNKNMDIKTISEIVELTEEEINCIKNN